MTTNHKPKVLVVDDSKSINHYITAVLKEAGFDTLGEADGESGLRRVQEYGPDVMILDIIMPKMSGLEVLRILRQRGDPISILLLSTKSSLKDIVTGLDAGADDYIIKPFNDDELVARVKVAARKTLGNKELMTALEDTGKNYKSLKKEKVKLLDDLMQANEELKRANKTILTQHKKVIADERSKVLLQMAGTTAHELSQPLTTLLGNIELLELKMNNPEKLARHICLIEKSGNRIADIVRKIQNIRHDETEPYLGKSAIIRLDQEINILYVEDSDDDFRKINGYLRQFTKVKLSHAYKKKDGLKKLKNHPYDLIFLNHLLADGNSFDFIEAMKEEGLEIPVVIINGHEDEAIATQLIQAGAYDYMIKDKLNENDLSRCINNALETFHLRREMKLAMEKMDNMAIRDELTGLYNRRHFMKITKDEIKRAREYGNDLTLCMAVPDHFEQINYPDGDPAGDLILTDVARIFSKSLRSDDILCRYESKKFAMMLPETTPENAMIFYERLRNIFSQNTFKYNSSPLQLTVSAGIAAYKDSPDLSPSELVAMADNALDYAREHGGNQACSHETMVSALKVDT